MSTLTPPNSLASELWATQTASNACFPDERLNTRFGIILNTLADKPLDSFPQACGSVKKTKGLYRFIANKRLDADDILQPFTDTTLDTCRGLPTILAIQDTSSTNYNTLKCTKGLGKLNDSDARGLHVHTTLAVGLDGVLRGLLDQSYWSRPVDQPPIADTRNERPIQEKESYKWLEGIEAVETALETLPEHERPRAIHVFDREGDIHEVLQHISASPHGAVIRCTQNRNVAGDIGKAHDAVAATPLIGAFELAVPAKHGVKKRTAHIEVRAVPLTITPSTKKHPHRQPVTWTLVEAREIGAPEGVEPLHWLLWTTESAQTLQEIQIILHWYRLRWLIEDFHLTLKSGCQVEELRLETDERLIKALTIYSAVAVRIVALRDLARQQPNAPCKQILSDFQWRALFAHFTEKAATADTPIPTIRQAVLWIGRLGGHLNRKGDGMPGVRTLWRGWRDLAVLVAGFRASQRSQ